LKLAISGLR